MDSEQTSQKIEELLGEYSTSRDELVRYMSEVDDARSHILQMFPEKLDFRNRMVLEEKLKTLSSFYSMLLNLRQEFNKSLKEEIELRRKAFGVGEKDDGPIDIRKLAEEIEKREKKKTKPGLVVLEAAE